MDKKANKLSKNRQISKILIYTFLVLFLLISLVPLLMMWMTALRPSGELVLSPLSIPEKFTLETLKEAWVIGRMGKYLMNSLIVAVPRVLGVLTLGCLAGYGFAKLRFPGRDIIFYVLLIGMMIPIQAMIIPMYYNMQRMNLINTYWALILPAFGLSMPFSIFYMRAFFRDLPSELMEAAKIDGCGELSTFLRIMLPLTKPALSSLFIFEFMWSWNDFLLPMLMVYDDKLRTLPLGITYFSNQFTTNQSLVAAGVAIASLPIVIVYIIFQKNFIQGITAGAIKG